MFANYIIAKEKAPPERGQCGSTVRGFSASVLAGDKKSLDSLKGRSRASLMLGFIAQVRVAIEVGKP